MNNPFIKIFLRELNRISERKTLYLLTIILPLLLFVFLGYIYKYGVVRELPVVVLDEDHSELSRLIARSVDAASSMRVIHNVTSLEEIQKEYLRGQIQGAFYIPKGLESRLKSGKSATVVIYKNTSNLIIGNTLYKDGVTVVRTISAGILLKKLRSRGLSYEKALNIVNPVKIDANSLFNPHYNYVSYLIPGLITALLQMIIMISAVLIISSEFAHGTFTELLGISGHSLLSIVAGKALPHLLIHYITALGIIGIVFPFFSIEIQGSGLSTYLLMVYYITAVFFVGLFISSMFHEQLFATELALFINTPAFIFSGFTFPLWGMPYLHNLFAQIIPFTHFLSGFVKVYQMNTPAKYLMPEYLKLSFFLVPALIGTFIALSHQMKHNKGSQAGSN